VLCCERRENRVRILINTLLVLWIIISMINYIVVEMNALHKVTYVVGFFGGMAMMMWFNFFVKF
jgi:hypothetical protein